jgi:formamidopyrimidine-DNA glycosylase
MPELPEVEIVRRDLERLLVGRRIVAVARLDWPAMVEAPAPDEFLALLPGSAIVAVERRAKWLLLRLSTGLTLAIHLRMTGNLFVRGAGEEADGYTHFVLGLDGGEQLFFRDVRKFGRLRLLDEAGVAALDARHGPEPLLEDFDAQALAARLRGRRTRLKPALLDQQVIAGMGNIYVDEALWLARLNPLRVASSLSEAEVGRLHAAIRQVLTAAIGRGGSTLRDYRNGFGERGEAQHYHEAYGREGQPCRRCGTPIERIVLGQRGTHFCPHCQPLAAPFS